VTSYSIAFIKGFFKIGHLIEWFEEVPSESARCPENSASFHPERGKILFRI
jgi:hypothetical protein